MVPTAASIPSTPYSHDLGSVPLCSLYENPADYALNVFFTFYANPPAADHERRGCFEYVVPLYSRAGEESALKMSVMAVASIMFLAWMDRRPDDLWSRGWYLRAVGAMKVQLENPENCADDEMLAAVLMLQMYEVSIGS